MSITDIQEMEASPAVDGDLTPGGTEVCQELQTELEYRLLALVDYIRARITAVAAELGLTPQQAILLRHLDRPRTMSDLAAILACDRSNVTGLVDRLLDRGLVERVNDLRDRRVKHLLLTEDGRAYRAQLQARLLTESTATAELTPSERRQLLTLLRKLTPDLVEAADAIPGRKDASSKLSNREGE